MAVLNRTVSLDSRPDVDEEQRAREIDDVIARLAKKKGKTICSANNLDIILGTDPLLVDALRFNAFKSAEEWYGDPIEDSDLTSLRLAIGRTYGITPGLPLIAEMTHYAAKRRSHNPVRDYLNGLRWDGKHRLATMLTTYAGAEDTHLHAELGRRFMVSAVARAMQDKSKVDTVLILAGPQGTLKSTFFRSLAGDDWFCDTALDMRNKDAYMALRGVWIYELAELDAVRPRDATTVKAFLSAEDAHYRPPFGRKMIDEPRRCVFVGTTNEIGFLTDPTGARRFWVVEVKGQIRIIELRAARNQLWAEAVDAYRRGERWWLEATGEGQLEESQKHFEAEDPWEIKIAAYLDSKIPGSEVSISAILTDGLEIEVGNQHKGMEMRAGGILARLGYGRHRISDRGRRVYVWSRPSTIR